MEPQQIYLSQDNNWSYYLQYNEHLDLTSGTINMFGYCRVSTQLQAMYGSSITTQIQLLYDDCNRLQFDENNKAVKYNLMRIYVDNGISAKNIKGRPSLINIQSHVNSLITGKTHQKIGIIVSDLSRLTRSSEDLETLIKWIKESSLKLKFIDSSIDVSSNAGKMMLTMLAGFFEFERKNSSFKTLLTLRAMSENGTLTGHCSYGWTTGTDQQGRKTNVPVSEEQEGLNMVIKLSRENPEMKPCQIKKMMNELGIICLRGPGRNFRGKYTDKSIFKNSQTVWTGLWTTQIISNIIEHDRFEDRQKIVKENAQPINIMKKDEIVIQMIKDYLDKTNEYVNESFNISEITRYIDNQNIFQKKLNRNYVRDMMITAKIIKPEIKDKVIQTDEDIIVNSIRELICTEKINTYIRLNEVLIEKNITLIGKRKNWNKTNVRDLCIKYNIILFDGLSFTPVIYSDEKLSTISASNRSNRSNRSISPNGSIVSVLSNISNKSNRTIETIKSG